MSSIFVRHGERVLRLEARGGEPVLDVLRRAGLPVQAVCGGRGTCGKCRVLLEGPAGPQEALACRLPAADGMRLALPLASNAPVCCVTSSGAPSPFPLSPRAGAGAAVDLGTTTVAAELFDLSTGQSLGRAGAWNAQAAFGADVLTRIAYVMEHDGGLALLQDVLRRQVLSLVEELCRRHLPPGRRAGELFLSGNTVMQHIACGLSPVPIAKAPFAPPTLFWQEAPLEWEGLAVRLSPCVAGYVGGDITAGLLSCGRLLGGRSLFVDVGTNGEMALHCGDGFLCCAVATGPAFEGGGISCGMAGLPGAVRRMSWDGAGPVLEVIGGGRPRGLCGSGLLDALALLLELGAVDQSGRLLPPDEAPPGLAPWLERDQNGNGVFFFTPDRSLFLTAGDLRALQLAKGAVAAGIEVLLRRAGLSAGELDGLYLAGGLGSSLNPQSALRIGMFPPQLAGKITALGNTALAGAGEALLSEQARAALFGIARRCTYVELSGDADFSRAFPEHLLFEQC